MRRRDSRRFIRYNHTIRNTSKANIELYNKMYSIRYFSMYGSLIMVPPIALACLGSTLKNTSCLKSYINFKGDSMIPTSEGDLPRSTSAAVRPTSCAEAYESASYAPKAPLVNARFSHEKKGAFELRPIKDIKDDHLGAMINVLCVLRG